MILGPVSLIDCAVFCVFLAPQLIWNVGFFRTVLTVIRCLDFLRSSFLVVKHQISHSHIRE